MKKRKMLKKILMSMKNVSFKDMQLLAEYYGFDLDRINGSHHIYVHPKIEELVNIQNVKGKTKPYQVISGASIFIFG